MATAQRTTTQGQGGGRDGGNGRDARSTGASGGERLTPDLGATRGQSFERPVEDFGWGPYTSKPSLSRRVMDGYLMRTYDPTVRAALTLMRLMVKSRLGAYEHSNTEIQEFIRTGVKQIYGGFPTTVNALLSCLWAGYSVAQKWWSTDSSQWVIERLDTLHPCSFIPKGDMAGIGDDAEKPGLKFDKRERRVTRAIQAPEKWGEKPTVLPIENILYWPFMSEFAEEVWGNRLTDAARRGWYMQTKLEGYWAVFCEKFASPIPVILVPKGSQTVNGTSVPNSKFYAEKITQLKAGQGFALEVDPTEAAAIKIMYLESDKGTSDAYDKACRYYNAQVFKSCLMSPLMLEEPQHGSRAQAEQAFEAFLTLLEGIMAELGGVLIEQYARPQVEYNYGLQDDYGEWKFDELRGKDLDMLASIFQRVEMTGAVTLTKADEASLRETFGDAGFVSMEEAEASEPAAVPTPLPPSLGGRGVPGNGTTGATAAAGTAAPRGGQKALPGMRDDTAAT